MLPTTVTKENPKWVSDLPIPIRPVNSVTWQFMLISGAVMYGSYSILMHLCEDKGAIPFSSTSVVLLIELLKLVVSLVIFLPDYHKQGLHMVSLKTSLPFAFPAVLYAANNNIAVHVQIHLDAASYQILCNMKIVSTVILYRLIIKRPITQNQWIALILLSVAGFCNSYGGLQEKKVVDKVYVTLTGVILMIVYCIISGLAGVFTEYVLKKQELPLSLQNIFLYIFGVICNILGFLSTDNKTLHFFQGYSIYTWLIIITQVGNGLIMSVIMKYASNLTRLFLISSAMLITIAMSITVLNLKLNIFFYSTFVLVTIALKLYHN